MLIKPFTAQVNASGQAIVTISHSIHGLQWYVYQVGFALGVNSPLAQVAAHVNGAPLMATVTMQPSVFGLLIGQPPYAMESFMSGPPYITLLAGDQIVCGVIHAAANDTFTCTAYVDEYDATYKLPLSGVPGVVPYAGA